MSLGLYVHEKLIPLLLAEVKINEGPLNNIKNELTKKLIKKKLAEVRDFGNFDHENMCVATKIKIGDQEILQIDFPLGGDMSAELTKDYNYLNKLNNNDKYDNDDYEEREKEKRAIPWYENQASYIQHLIKKYASQIKMDSIFPTQLRRYISGAKNVGEEFIVDIRSGKIIQHHYHSATPAHTLEIGSQVATNQSITQLKSLTNAQHMLVLSLLSPISRLSDDSDLVNQIDNAVKESKESNIHFSNIPVNGWRVIVPKQMTGVNWLVEEAKSHKDNKSLPLHSNERNNLVDLIQAFDRLSSGSTFKWDSENRNLQLVSVIERLGHAINEAHQITHPNDTQQFIAVVSACQSGKDRAGLARIKAVIDAAIHYFKPKSQVEKVEIHTAVINARQVPAQAGFKGGTEGADGLKSDTATALPSSWNQWKDALFKKTASYNKGIPKDPRKLKWYKNTNTLIAAGLLVVGGALCATGVGALVGAPLITGSIIGGVVGSLSVAAIGAGVGVGAVSTVAGIKYSIDTIKESYRISEHYNKRDMLEMRSQVKKTTFLDGQESDDKRPSNSNSRMGRRFSGIDSVPNDNSDDEEYKLEQSNEYIDEEEALIGIRELLASKTMISLEMSSAIIPSLKYIKVAELVKNTLLSRTNNFTSAFVKADFKSGIENEYPISSRPNHIKEFLKLKSLNSDPRLESGRASSSPKPHSPG